jgi:DNA-binding HxlR family transcriptional regulator
VSRATYAQLGDACATAHAMELIGARWTYPIVRELMLGPKRFGELLVSVRGITPAVLSARLRELTAAGLIQPARGGTPANLQLYDLTGWARELGPILRELGRWAQASPVRVDAGGLTPDACIQAMITMAEELVPATTVHLQLYLADERVDAATEHAYRVHWDESGFTASRGELADAACTLHADSTTWGSVLFAGLPLEESGARLTGDLAAVHALVAAYRPPVDQSPTF